MPRSKITTAYLLRFAARLLCFLLIALTWAVNRDALDFTQGGGLSVNLLWLALMVSFAVQLMPWAAVSRGCLKQFRRHYIPVPGHDEARFRETLKKLDKGAALTALVWLPPNLLFGLLYRRGLLGVPDLVLLTAFYFLSDLVCVLFYCPFQHLLMKNKCCVSCRIFAWGTIMAVTPLFFIPHPWVIGPTALSLVCFLRWEAVYRLRPERFTEETNAFLSCRDCTDRLCVYKKSWAKCIDKRRNKPC